MGRAAPFFDAVMTMAYARGIVVFVSTSNMLVTKFLHGLNDGTKARAFKTVFDKEKFTCQAFKWTEEKRLEFLKLRNEQKELNIDNERLVALADEAYQNEQSIRDMDTGLAGLITHSRTGASDSEETQDNQPFLCGGCRMS
jgi:hypothetical protein